MNKSLFGEVIETEQSAKFRPVEVRYSIAGERVRFAKNVAAVFNAAAARAGLKGMKEAHVFQAIFDQSVDALFSPSPVIELPLAPGRIWRLDMSAFKSVGAFNEAAERMHPEGQKQGPSGEPEPELDGEGAGDVELSELADVDQGLNGEAEEGAAETDAEAELKRLQEEMGIEQ